MTAHSAEFFTLDEVNRLKIIQDVVDRRLTTLMAAQRLGISDRQCRRLLSRYREYGPLGMMTLMCIDHLRMTMIWPHFSHGGNSAVFQNP